MPDSENVPLLDFRIDYDHIRAALPSGIDPGSISIEIDPGDRVFPNPQPGTPFSLVLVNEFRDSMDSRNFAASFKPGIYRLTFVLQRPGASELQPDENVSADAQFGSSFIRVLLPEHNHRFLEYGLKFSIPSRKGMLQCVGLLNPQGCLGRIMIHRYRADSFSDVSEDAQTAISRWLSQISLLHEVPLLVSSTQFVEFATGNQVLAFRTPQNEISYEAVRGSTSAGDLAVYASFYREGLVNPSPVYQFFCFYKIIEGIFKRQARLDAPVIAKGGSPQRERTRLPADAKAAREWLEPLYPGRRWDDVDLKLVLPDYVRGKRITQIKKGMLDDVRVRVAHGLLDDGEPGLSPDEMARVSHLEELVPVTKLIARYLLYKAFPDFFHQQVPLGEAIHFVPASELVPSDNLAEPPILSNIRFSVSSTQTPTGDPR